MGLCPECASKYDDKTEKELFECPYCKRLFCSVHLPARLTQFGIFRSEDVNSKWLRTLQVESQKKNSHPCRQYLPVYVLEEEKKNESVAQALDKMVHPENYVPIAPLDLEADRQKRIDILTQEESELNEQTVGPTVTTSEKKQIGKPQVKKKHWWQKIKSFFSS